MPSKKYSLNKEDLISILKGLIITLTGATLTYMAKIVTETDFGDYTPIMVAIFALFTNVVRKYLQGTNES